MNRRASYRKCLAAVLIATLARGTWATNVPVVWDGDTDADWSNGLNWAGDAPPAADDHAKITGTFDNQPTLTGPTSVGGVWITELGQNYEAVANDQVLNISGNTINEIPNVAVLFDNSSGFNAIINNGISIASDNLVIRNDTDNELRFFAENNLTAPVVNLNANTLTFSNNGAGQIVTSNIGGSGGVTIDSLGAGVVVTNHNGTSFSGQLTIARGILQTNSVNNNAANGKLGNSALSVILGSAGNTGTLLYNNGAAQTSSKRFTLADDGTGVFDMQQTAAVILTLTGVIDGSGALEVKGNGTGTLQLNGANTFTGGTRLVSGILSLGSNSAVGTGTLTLAGGRLSANANRSIANPIVTDGSSTITPATGTLTLSGPLTSTSDTDVINLLQLVSSTVVFTGDVSGFHGTFNRNTMGSTLNFGVNDVDASNARFVMTGTASGVNRYLRFGDGGVSETTASIKMGDLSGGGVINPGAGSLTELNVAVGYLNEPNSEFSGAFLGRATQTFNVTKVGTGVWTLSGPSSHGANTASGTTTTVSAGTLIAGGNVPVVTLTNVPGFSTANGSDILTTPISHSLEINDQVSFQGTLAGGLVAVTTYHVVDVLSATEVKLATTQGGTPIVFSAAQSPTTPPTIAQLTPFGSGSTAIVLGDADTDSNDVSLLIGGAFTIERGVNVTSNGSGTATIGGNTFDDSTFSGEILLAKDVRLSSIASGGSAVNVTGVISSSGDFGVTKVGFGDAILSGTNTYTGDTTVEAGTLSITNAYLNDAADVYLTTGSLFDLAFLGTDVINSLFIDGVMKEAGKWGAIGSIVDLGADYESDLITGTGLLSITTSSAGFPGDFNFDGKVDAADYVVWRDTMSSQPGKYDEWKANFGAGPAGSGAVVGDQTAVPEPASLALAACLAIGVVGYRWR